MVPVVNHSLSLLSPHQMQLVVDNCNQIKDYQSQFFEIRDIIEELPVIPESNTYFHALSVLQNFNEQLSPLKEIVGYSKNITNLKQLDALENRLIKIEYNLKHICRYSQNVKCIHEVTDVALQYNGGEENDSEAILECNDQSIPMDCNEDMFTDEQLKTLQGRLLDVAFRLRELKEHRSKFESINEVIQSIPKHIAIQDVLIVVKRFNEEIFILKQIVDYHQEIFNVNQLRVLENRLVKWEGDLKQIQQHQSSYICIDQAIKAIPTNIRVDEVLQIIEQFNIQLASCKIIACYYEYICNKKQVVDLEQRLNSCDRALTKIWNSLHIINRPYLNTISSIRAWFGNPRNQVLLDKVTSLKLIDCNISLLPPELVKLHNLQELDLSVNNVSVLPKWINQLTALKVLSISCNRLGRFPTSISRCTFLESLDMSNTQMKEFPIEILRMNNLQKLNLSINQITVVPSSIYRCKVLKVLNLSYNQLRELPSQICYCSSLENLDVSFNLIEKVPLSLIVWSRVKRILLNQEKKSSEQLEVMNLSGNFLSSLSCTNI